MSGEEIRHLLALKFTPGIGDVSAKQLISYCGSAEAVFRESKGALLKVPTIGEKTIASIQSSKSLTLADDTLSKCEKYKVSILPYYHSEYPSKLKLVNDAPLLIYKKGTVFFPERKAVGIVGTRNATEYGRMTTEKIVDELIAHQAVVVSGLAYGIDVTAHRASLKCGLPTVAVLAGGLDRIYPTTHRKTADEMLEMGGWISEQIPGVMPEPHFFPARNRIIAGMSDALVVVEAASKGGALITANIAYSYNREVFAVPGDLANKFSAGCNALIRNQKANIYTTVKDLEYILGWERGVPIVTKSILDLTQFSLVEQQILKVLMEFDSGLPLDELCWKTQININESLSLLLNLEFAGVVKSLPGKRYMLA